MADCYLSKQSGGVMLPADDETAEYLTSIKTGSYLRVKITKPRNYQFHKKVFAFFQFCFAHWSGELACEFLDEQAQCYSSKKKRAYDQLRKNEDFQVVTMSFNLDDLPKKDRVELEHHRLDCLMREYLKRFRDGRVDKKQVETWFSIQPATWTESGNRRERMEQALIKLRGIL